MVRSSFVAVTIAILTLGLAFAVVPAPGPAMPTRADAALQAAFRNASPEWLARISSDETMLVCSATGNKPAPAFAKQIDARATATIQYPPDGNLMGDWQAGEKIAQSGYGLRFTDDPATRPNGGNCYACHQLTKAEVSYGTIGPSLLGYGKSRKFKPSEVRAAYEKIYNSQSAVPCSLMPRFGANGVLSIEQIRDLTALLMSPESPVNQ